MLVIQTSVSSWLTVARKKGCTRYSIYENKASCVKSVKIQTFCRCNEGTIDDGPVKNPNRAGCNVIETIWLLKFPQVQGSLQPATKVAQDKVVYESEPRGLKI